MNLHGTGRRNGTYRSILLNAIISQSGEKFPEIVFFPDGSGTPIPVSTLVKDLGVQTDNMFSPSALFRLVSVFLVYSLKKAASLSRRKFLLRNVYRWTPKKSSVMNQPTVPNLFN